MDHYLMIWTVAVFVESRLQSGFDYAALEKATGFSLPHIRAVYKKLTGQSICDKVTVVYRKKHTIKTLLNL